MAEPLAYSVAALVTVPVYPVEVTSVEILDDSTSPTGARLFAPHLDDLTMTSSPKTLLPDHPLELHFSLPACIGVGSGSNSAVARAISTHLRVSINWQVAATSGECARMSPVAAITCDGYWRTRILQSPSVWAKASAIDLDRVTVDSAPVAMGQVPVTVRVGYNHSIAPAGLVLAAATNGDVPALWAALGDGGSTEESAVRGGLSGPMLYDE